MATLHFIWKRREPESDAGPRVRANAPRCRVLRGRVAGHPRLRCRSPAEFETAAVECRALIGPPAGDILRLDEKPPGIYWGPVSDETFHAVRN
jgi:hypothetical protein